MRFFPSKLGEYLTLIHVASCKFLALHIAFLHKISLSLIAPFLLENHCNQIFHENLTVKANIA